MKKLTILLFLSFLFACSDDSGDDSGDDSNSNELILFEYPQSGDWGMNILDLNITDSSDTNGDGFNDLCVDVIDFDVEYYSLRAKKITDDDAQLKVKLTLLSDNDLCNEDENGYCWPWWFVKLYSPSEYEPIPSESSGWTTVSTLDLEGNLPLADELMINSENADIGIMVRWDTNLSYDADGIPDGYEPVIVLVEYYENNMSTPIFSKELVFDCLM